MQVTLDAVALGFDRRGRGRAGGLVLCFQPVAFQGHLHAAGDRIDQHGLFEQRGVVDQGGHGLARGVAQQGDRAPAGGGGLGCSEGLAVGIHPTPVVREPVGNGQSGVAQCTRHDIAQRVDVGPGAQAGDEGLQGAGGIQAPAQQAQRDRQWHGPERQAHRDPVGVGGEEHRNGERSSDGCQQHGSNGTAQQGRGPAQAAEQSAPVATRISTPMVRNVEVQRRRQGGPVGDKQDVAGALGMADHERACQRDAGREHQAWQPEKDIGQHTCVAQHTRPASLEPATWKRQHDPDQDHLDGWPRRARQCEQVGVGR